MFRNYLTTALRSMMKRRGHAAINIIGLTIGLTACLIIFQFVAHERGFDRFHDNLDDLYRVVVSLSREEGESYPPATFTSQAAGPALAATIPGVVRYARVHPSSQPAIITVPGRVDDVFEEPDVLHVDRAFLQMFTFPVLAGSGADALARGTVVITESMARKYFGGDAVGKEIEIRDQASDAIYRVAAVLRDVPPTSHLQFDFLVPIEHLLEAGQYADEAEGGWSFNNFITYVQLESGMDDRSVSEAMTELFVAQRGQAMGEYGFKDLRMTAQPLRDVYLDDQVTAFGTEAGSHRTVRFFTIIGLVTLLIALVNYVNLATARALDRAREVGVRKSVGARRGQLATQFLAESTLTIALSGVLALVAASLLLPMVNNIADVSLSWRQWLSIGFAAGFVGMLLVAAVLAGFYPALVLSRFRPASVLKGNTDTGPSQSVLRQGLVVVQFAAAVVLIGGTAIVFNQLNFMRNMELGIDLDQVITVPGPRIIGDATLTDARQTLAAELVRLPNVSQVATSMAVPGHQFNWQGASTWRADAEQESAISGVATWIDTTFVALYGFEVIAGRNFSAGDPSWGGGQENPVLVNETAVRELGFASPTEAIDHPILIGGSQARIVGVLKDFHWSSAHTTRRSVFFGRVLAGAHLSLRVAATDLPATLASIEETYMTMYPGNVFHYTFLDEAFGAQYREDQRFASLFGLFAGLAIAIACLGLFGLASFTAQKRRKEVGVRKVLGASEAAIVSLLSREFLKLVAIAILIGSPIAYLLMRRWLEEFAYRIEVGPAVFLIVAGITIAIAIMTVAWQAIRAAMTDPVRALRYE
jgi:putative ABC transport system permease protein